MQIPFINLARIANEESNLHFGPHVDCFVRLTNEFGGDQPPSTANRSRLAGEFLIPTEVPSKELNASTYLAL